MLDNKQTIKEINGPAAVITIFLSLVHSSI
ncbi:hypothetical protein J2Z25_003316 [Clostridium tertium]|nr:hypothetical protein [Clostridium tertium]